MSDNNRRIIALVLAILAAMLVMMAGRACARDIQHTNEIYRTTAAPDLHISLADPAGTVTPTPQATEQPTDIITSEVATAAVVTDLIGRVVGTVPPTSEGETVETSEPTTVKKSILEEYNEKQAAQNSTEAYSDAYAGGYGEAVPAQTQISINVY